MGPIKLSARLLHECPAFMAKPTIAASLNRTHTVIFGRKTDTQTVYSTLHIMSTPLSIPQMDSFFKNLTTTCDLRHTTHGDEHLHVESMSADFGPNYIWKVCNERKSHSSAFNECSKMHGQSVYYLQADLLFIPFLSIPTSDLPATPTEINDVNHYTNANWCLIASIKSHDGPRFVVQFAPVNTTCDYSGIFRNTPFNPEDNTQWILHRFPYCKPNSNNSGTLTCLLATIIARERIACSDSNIASIVNMRKFKLQKKPDDSHTYNDFFQRLRLFISHHITTDHSGAFTPVHLDHPIVLQFIVHFEDTIQHTAVIDFEHHHNFTTLSTQNTIPKQRTDLFQQTLADTIKQHIREAATDRATMHTPLHPQNQLLSVELNFIHTANCDETEQPLLFCEKINHVITAVTGPIIESDQQILQISASRQKETSLTQNRDLIVTIRTIAESDKTGNSDASIVHSQDTKQQSKRHKHS